MSTTTVTAPAKLVERAERAAALHREAGFDVEVDYDEGHYGTWFATVTASADGDSLAYRNVSVMFKLRPGSRTGFVAYRASTLYDTRRTTNLREAEIIAYATGGLYRHPNPDLRVRFR